jgi:ceramide glucosyltransferase
METLLLAIGLLLSAIILSAHYLMSRALGRARDAPPVGRYPALTVIRPIRGLDVGAAENFTAALEAEYAGELETLFVLDDASDPALPVVLRCVEHHRKKGGRGRAEVLFAGRPPPGMTGKLNAMAVGARVARGELIAFGDSDTRPARDLLTHLVDTLLERPAIGCAFAPVVVRTPARTAGDVGYALLIDGWYGPAVARLAEKNGGAVPFIMGQLMLFRREALAAIGGVECATGQLVDDMYLGKALARAGWRNHATAAQLDIVTGGMSFPDFLRLYRRWLLFSRNGLPASFTAPHWARAGVFWAALVVATAALLRGAWLVALPSLGAMLVAVVSQVRLQARIGGPAIALRHLWMPLALLLSMPFGAFIVLFDRNVEWRGRAYALKSHARLAAVPSVAPEPAEPSAAVMTRAEAPAREGKNP